MNSPPHLKPAAGVSCSQLLGRTVLRFLHYGLLHHVVHPNLFQGRLRVSENAVGFADDVPILLRQGIEQLPEKFNADLAVHDLLRLSGEHSRHQPFISCDWYVLRGSERRIYATRENNGPRCQWCWLNSEKVCSEERKNLHLLRSPPHSWLRPRHRQADTGSITGKTQKEVREKLQEISVDLNNGIYRETSKMTVGQWLDTWQSTYLEDVKPRTKEIYTSAIRLHLKPALGAVQLEALDAPTIQQFYNALGKPSKTREQWLSPKTVKSLHGILHRALSQAVKLGYLRYNPSDACTLPKAQRKEFIPLASAEIAAFLKEINGTRLEALLTLTLFTGMREGEILGLT